jgi:UPF0755 protein
MRRLLPDRPPLRTAAALLTALCALQLSALPQAAGMRSEIAARESAVIRVFYEVEVRAGERTKDFCARSRDAGLSCEDLEARSAHIPWFRQQRGLRRFEGVFVPGKYRVGVEQRFAQYKSHVADRIFEALLLRAKERLGSLPAPEENMILASMAQKESVSGRNYAEVASVFRNRLEKNMPLGSCPTVEYALGYHRPFLTAEDISIDSPYNVYRRKGLPPSPIAFFSDAAWKAATTTPSTPYTFFVYDWTTGKLHFSKDYGTHMRLAQAARANYVRKFGRGALRQVHRDRFYE